MENLIFLPVRFLPSTCTDLIECNSHLCVDRRQLQFELVFASMEIIPKRSTFLVILIITDIFRSIKPLNWKPLLNHLNKQKIKSFF